MLSPKRGEPALAFILQVFIICPQHHIRHNPYLPLFTDESPRDVAAEINGFPEGWTQIEPLSSFCVALIPHHILPSCKAHSAHEEQSDEGLH